MYFLSLQIFFLPTDGITMIEPNLGPCVELIHWAVNMRTMWLQAGVCAGGWARLVTFCLDHLSGLSRLPALHVQIKSSSSDPIPQTGSDKMIPRDKSACIKHAPAPSTHTHTHTGALFSTLPCSVCAQTWNQLSNLSSEVPDKYLSTEQLVHNALL